MRKGYKNSLLVGLLTAAVCFASEAGKTVYQLADGIVRPSIYKGASEAYFPITVNSSHAASLVPLPNGDLLCFWYAGIYERGHGVSILMSKLMRGSHRWSQPVIVSNHPGWANQNPVGFRAPDGRLWLLHTTQKGDQQKDIVYGLTSDDEGVTWTAPRDVFSRVGLYLRQPLVVFQQQWILPVYHSAGKSVTSGANKDHSYVEISKDQGKTWNECDIPGSDGLVQMNIIKLSDDQLIAFFRSRYADWIYKSESTDGCHWNAPVATTLPNNNSSIQAVRLKDGHLAMMFNNTQATTVRGKAMTGSRLILSVGLSTDGGKTWPWIRDVETANSKPAIEPDEDPEYSYPSISQMPDGRIVMAYTFRRETLKYMTFDEEWIKQGGTVGGKPEDAHPESIARLNQPTSVKGVDGF